MPTVRLDRVDGVDLIKGDITLLTLSHPQQPTDANEGSDHTNGSDHGLEMDALVGLSHGTSSSRASTQ